MLDPLFTGTAIAACIAWLVLPPRMIEGVIVDVLAVMNVSTNHGPSTVGANLDFRRSTNKRPNKKGGKPITDKCILHRPKRRPKRKIDRRVNYYLIFS